MSFYKLGWFLFTWVLFTPAFAFRLTKPLGFGCICPDIHFSPIHIFAVIVVGVLISCLFWCGYFAGDIIIGSLVKLVKQNKVAVEKLDKENPK